MTQPILYKRTKTGAVQYWEIQVVPLPDGTAVITKTSGQYGTDKPLENVEVITKGKNLNRSNAATPIEQAKLQADSDWRKKLDQGYKTVDTLGIAYAEDKLYPWTYNGAHYTELKAALEAALPKYNSDAQGQVKCMLAQTVNWAKVTYPCLVQPKADGVRTLLIFDGTTVTFLSRTGKPYTTLGHIATEVLEKFTGPMILDGEIYAHDLTFQEIVAAVKKQRDNSLQLRFKAYDIVNEAKQLDRARKLSELLDTRALTTIHRLQTMTCNSKEEVIALHNHWVEEGYEGLMIRLHHGLYEQGQRSSALLKVKEFDTTEFPFVEFILGQRGVEDLIASCTTSEGLTFRAKLQGTVAEKQELYKQTPPAGTLLTIKHHGYTDQNLPRFPIGIAFRDYE